MGEYVRVARVADVAPGSAKRVEVHGKPVALFNVEGEFYAIGDICSHAHASLSEGYLEDGVVECPLHGARFDVRTGRNLSLPALFPVAKYEVKVVDDEVLVAVKD